MLKNNPPPGTAVQIVRTGELATLIRPLRKLREDRPDDEFQIRLASGAVMTVLRVALDLA
jgi:hypothetical protein